MESIENQDEIRSEDVRDFLEKIPSWIIRWGILALTIAVFSSLILLWYIRYPTIVTAEFSLSSSELPIPIIPKVNSRIESLFFHENDEVKKGEILAFLESTSNHDEVLKLEGLLDTIDLLNYYLPIGIDSLAHLGELQGDFQTFQKVNSQVQLLINDGFYIRERMSLEADITSLLKINEIAGEQLILHTRDAQLSKEEFQINEKLYNNKVIAVLDLYREESKKIAKELPIKSLTSSIQNNNSLINLKVREISNLDNNILELKSSFIQSLNNFKNEIQLWKSKYLLISPIDGLIYSSKIIQEQQMVKSGEEIFYIVSSSDYSLGQIRIPQDNFGKVKIGQKVLIKFQAFPFQEYGVVNGIVLSISTLPASDNSFFATVDLPNGLTTNSGKRLNFRLGMSATAEIVTQDLRLLERLMSGIKRNFDITE
jgi:HlyD family secretion protein